MKAGVVDWIISLPNPYVEAWIPNVIAFGDRMFKEIMQVKWSYKAEALIW